MSRIKTSLFLVLWLLIGQCCCFFWNPYKPNDHKTVFKMQLIHRLKGTTFIFFILKNDIPYIFLYFRFPESIGIQLYDKYSFKIISPNNCQNSNFFIILELRNRLQFLMGKVTQSTKGLISNPTPRPHSTLNEKYLFTMKKQRIDQLGRL